jgi:hypothetical protein
MPDFDQVREIKARVQARLFGIHGVHAVGVGHKSVNSQPINDVAIMVFVVKKKLLAELAPEEVIPAEIEGVKPISTSPTCPAVAMTRHGTGRSLAVASWNPAGSLAAAALELSASSPARKTRFPKSSRLKEQLRSGDKS